MSNEPHTYLKHDMLTLLVLGVVITAVLAALWYLEQHGGGFSRLAASVLDAATR